jgi:hypothetical protein
MNLDKKRRAVFTTLSTVLEGDELWQAMWAWQNRYANRSQYELNGFFNEIRHLRAIADNRATLYRQLIALLMGDNQPLKPDPLPQMEAYRERFGMVDLEVGVSDASWVDGFRIVLNQLYQQAPAETWRKVRAYAEDQGQRKRLPQELLYAFSLWSEGRKVNNPVEAGLPELRDLLNLLYVGMCEQLGPVVADKMLSRAVNTAVAAGLDSDPRLLLVHRD